MGRLSEALTGKGTTILGVGNRLLPEDSFGVLVVEACEGRLRPGDGRAVQAETRAAQLLAETLASERVVYVDAVDCGFPRGFIGSWRWSPRRHCFCPHDLGPKATNGQALPELPVGDGARLLSLHGYGPAHVLFEAHISGWQGAAYLIGAQAASGYSQGTIARAVEMVLALSDRAKCQDQH